MKMVLLTKCIVFDVYLTLAWSRKPLKNIRLSQQNYMEFGTLILKGIENMDITSKECYHPRSKDDTILSETQYLSSCIWSICGGLMSERYSKTKEPTISELNTLSLRKYKKMIDAWGGWSLFQELLSTLNRIAQKYNVDIANVATRFFRYASRSNRYYQLFMINQIR
jgi:hypothetical protein